MEPLVRPARQATAIAQLFGFTAAILMLVWLFHYRGGLNLDSDNKDHVFNVHPFMMFFGLIFFAGQAMMAYKTVPAVRKVQKFVHMMIHLISLSLGIVGIYAVFKYHREVNVPDMYSLHSWIGMGTFCLYGLQWLVGFATFWLPMASLGSRARLLPWHVYGGRTILFMAICTAVSGLMEKATFIGLRHGHESRVINFTGLTILLYGIAVDFSVTLSSYYV